MQAGFDGELDEIKTLLEKVIDPRSRSTSKLKPPMHEIGYAILKPLILLVIPALPFQNDCYNR